MVCGGMRRYMMVRGSMERSNRFRISGIYYYALDIRSTLLVNGGTEQ